MRPKRSGRRDMLAPPRPLADLHSQPTRRPGARLSRSGGRSKDGPLRVVGVNLATGRGECERHRFTRMERGEQTGLAPGSVRIRRQ